jgi:hypothetical protein
MGISEKIPLINSSNVIVKIAGYVVYAFVLLIIIGAIFGSDEEKGSATTTSSSKEDSKLTSIPLGASATVDDWEISVSRFNPRATRIIENENMFNDEPSAGGQYAMVYIKAKNLGDTKRSFSATDLHLEGASGQVYDTPFFPPIAPEAFESEAFPGATAKGNVVFDIASEDADSVKLYYKAWGSDKTYFNLSRSD